MRIGLQGAFGRSQITIDDSATVGELQHQISEASSLPVFHLKGGFPPRPIDLSQFDPTTKLSDTGLKLNGERIQVEARDSGGPAKVSHKASHSNTAPAPIPSQPTSSSPAKQPTFTGQASQSSQSSKPPSKPMNIKPNKSNIDPPELPIRNGDSFLVHRVMPDDNSCLFRSIGKCVLGDSLDAMTELRSMVAQGIQAQPDRYNEVVLEQKPDDYCRWIQDPNSWGGAIDIGIIAEAFGLEVYAINVLDGSVQKFNEGQSNRSYLVYSGIHWDAIVENMVGRDGPGEIDVAQFPAYDEEILQKAQEIGKLLGKAGYYTDTKKLGIKCGICGWEGKGEAAAIEHSNTTTHNSFDQID